VPSALTPLTVTVPLKLEEMPRITTRCAFVTRSVRAPSAVDTSTW
jgi:hypothetical protein